MDEDGDEPPEFKRGRWPVTSLVMIAAVVVVIALAFGVWGAGRNQAAKRTERLEASVQDLLDVMYGAYLTGDGDLFFAGQAGDPAWLSAQLRPLNQFFYAAGPTVTRVEQFGNDIWANIQWQGTGADQTLQRVTFFQWRDGRLIQTPTVDSYWGPVEESNKAFGRLQLHEVDQQWERDIASFAVRVMAETCGPSASDACRAGSRPFTLTIAPDFALTAAPGQLRVPSPRLLGLDESGRPSTLSWNELRQALQAHLNPATVRFAVPEEFLNSYQEAAAVFSAEQPDVSVEIVALETLPPDPLSWPAEIDGAAMTPNERMITAGRVLDLTDFVTSDPGFDEGDFYEQIWQGSWWRERMWFMPQAADMQLLFYDRPAYQQAGLAEPSLRWTWAEMDDDLAELATMPLAASFRAIFVDPSRDTLFSYAFNLDNDCPGQATVHCTKPLSSQAVSATLEWYRSLAIADGIMADLSILPPQERDHAAINLTSPRRVILWAEAPVLYEHHMLRQPTGVVPFPGSERFDGISPLWVQGSFISQLSAHPLATWEWLKFLSYQRLARQKRLVPARPSVAIESGYWTKLPRPVSEAMRIAFPFARPVLIEERGYFPWDQLAAISSGEQTPAEAAQALVRVRWFGRDIQ
jgi:ABC-type glycerol-3-phosphate transport system substrate-binding protein